MEDFLGTHCFWTYVGGTLPFGQQRHRLKCVFCLLFIPPPRRICFAFVCLPACAQDNSELWMNLDGGVECVIRFWWWTRSRCGAEVFKAILPLRDRGNSTNLGDNSRSCRLILIIFWEPVWDLLQLVWGLLKLTLRQGRHQNPAAVRSRLTARCLPACLLTCSTIKA